MDGLSSEPRRHFCRRIKKKKQRESDRWKIWHVRCTVYILMRSSRSFKVCGTTRTHFCRQHPSFPTHSMTWISTQEKNRETTRMYCMNVYNFYYYWRKIRRRKSSFTSFLVHYDAARLQCNGKRILHRDTSRWDYVDKYTSNVFWLREFSVFKAISRAAFECLYTVHRREFQIKK